MNECKPKYLSKMLWVNGLVLVMGILDLVSKQDWIPQQWVAVIIMSIGILNIILRFMTNQPIEPPVVVQKIKNRKKAE